MTESNSELPSSDELASIEAAFDARMRRTQAISEMICRHIAQRCRDYQIDAPLLWPGRFLLELGAILELGMWQISGQIPDSLAEYPSSDVLLEKLWQSYGQQAFRTKEGRTAARSSLQQALDRAWFEASHWDSLATIGVPFIVEQGDEDDELLDRLANLLWSNHHLMMPRKCADVCEK